MLFSLWLENIVQTENIVKNDITDVYTYHGIKRPIRYNVYKNPTKQELLDTLENDHKIANLCYEKMANQWAARAFLTENGDLYVWPEGAVQHLDIAKALRVDIEYGFYIQNDLTIYGQYGNTESLKELLKQNPNYRRMMDLPSSPVVNKKKQSRNDKPSWGDVEKIMQKKPEPGSLQTLPYESKYVVLCNPE